MITLYMENFINEGHKTQKPLKLVIEDVEYDYEDGDLFAKLVSYQGYEIRVVHSGARTDTRNYVIYDVNLNGVPSIDLRD